MKYIFLIAVLLMSYSFLPPETLANDGVIKTVNWVLPTLREDNTTLKLADIKDVRIFYSSNPNADLDTYALIYTGVRTTEKPTLPLKFGQAFGTGSHCFALKVMSNKYTTGDGTILDTGEMISGFSNKMCLEVKGWPNPPTIVEITVTLQKPAGM